MTLLEDYALPLELGMADRAAGAMAAIIPLDHLSKGHIPGMKA